MTRIVTSFLFAFALTTAVHAQSGCSSDITGDGRTDGVDLAIVLTNWGPCSPGSAISGVYPSTGPTAGGTPIAIVGVNLGATASVTIGGVAVSTFTVVSPSVITLATPAGRAGTTSVVLRDGQGQELASTTFVFSMGSLPWASVLEQVPDPAVVPSLAVRTAIIATGYPWRVRDNGTGIEMLLVPPGAFDMGCSASTNYACFGGESPVHSVALTNALYVGRYEVTQAQWTAKMGSNPSLFQGQADSPNRPVERVSWTTVQGFLSASGLRLPTEAEWEFAYRAGTTTAFHSWTLYPNGTSDDNQVGSIAWYSSNSGGQTRPVGGKARNSLGLHDMSGNVWEWTSDWYGAYSLAPQTNPTGPATGSQRVLRGGSWVDLSNYLRSSHRGPESPGSALSVVGFRVARNP